MAGIGDSPIPASLEHYKIVIPNGAARNEEPSTLAYELTEGNLKSM